MKKTKYDLRIEQEFLHILSKIVDICPYYTLSQHLVHFLRKKGDKLDPYFWTNEKLLTRIDEYYNEIVNDLTNGDILYNDDLNDY